MIVMRMCRLLGIPMEAGAGRNGCRFGPTAYRRGGIERNLRALGHAVEDLGDVGSNFVDPSRDTSGATNRIEEVVAWLNAIAPAAEAAGADGALPVFLGGDHSLSAATVPAMARRAERENRPLFVLWLDAHPDLHDLTTTETGNLHGTPVAYFTALGEFAGFPPLQGRVSPETILQVGLRSIDKAERTLLDRLAISTIEYAGVSAPNDLTPIAEFLDRVRSTGGHLHVSLDTDFLDPGIAPGVGTTVPGGADEETAHAIMELVRDSGCLTSLDLVELNPTLDEADRTARLMTDIATTALGRTRADRKTGS